jgi:uncharacterized protein
MYKISLFLFLCFNLLYAKMEFPNLSGRVVDTANILTQQERMTLSSTLQQHEEKTTNQIVVVTLSSLNNYDIADYGYQLARYWGIGTKEKNNGVLLIIAPNERQLRIEVGYGLEGQLTDKLSHDIIHYKITPEFKKEAYYQGILKGTQEIINVIDGNSELQQFNNQYNVKNNTSFILSIILIILFSSISKVARKAKYLSLYKIAQSVNISAIGALIASMAGFGWLITLAVGVVIFVITFFVFLGHLKVEDLVLKETMGSGSVSSSSNGSFGGFSGGGGSFGGGGASGRW